MMAEIEAIAGRDIAGRDSHTRAAVIAFIKDVIDGLQ